MQEIKKSYHVCDLCPYHCVLKSGDIGKCLARYCNDVGVSSIERNLSVINIERIEKKPIFHFKPNSKVLSIGFYGCNLNCSYCQNFKISQNYDNLKAKEFSLDYIKEIVKNKAVEGVCFTYSEPLMYYENVVEVASWAKEIGLFTVLKTSACVKERYWNDILGIIDVINIDWKGSRDDYKNIVNVNLEFYSMFLNNIKKALYRKNIEISIPIYPHTNVSDMWILELTDIIYDINKFTPIHLLKIFPSNRELSWVATNDDKILAIRENIMKKLPFVYTANILGKESKIDTLDPESGEVLVRRNHLNSEVISYKSKHIVC